MKSCGGTNGGVYDRVIDHPVDLLFCLDKDLNIFVIPGKDLRESGNKGSLALRTEPTKNG